MAVLLVNLKFFLYETTERDDPELKAHELSGLNTRLQERLRGGLKRGQAWEEEGWGKSWLGPPASLFHSIGPPPAPQRPGPMLPW